METKNRIEKKEEREFLVIAHNIRSAYNVGSILRTADSVGVKKVFLTGYSASPVKEGKTFLTKAEKMVAKTALGAEKAIRWEKLRSISSILERLKKEQFEVVALEQDPKSIPYDEYVPEGKKIALLLGNEPKGIDKRTLRKCDSIIEIPMKGRKKSLNVSVAFGVAAHQISKYNLN